MTRLKPQRSQHHSLAEVKLQYIQLVKLCDETRPSCLNCDTAQLSCGYQTARPLAATPPFSDRHTTSTDSPTSINHPTVSTVSAGSPIPDTNIVTNSDDAILYEAPSHLNGPNMLHLALFHHMSTGAFQDFIGGSINKKTSFDTMINIALDAPFLMSEILAISALHLSTLRPDKNQLYSDQAAELQNHALTIFNNLPNGYCSENPIQVFFFSSFLGMHVLFDTLLFRPPEFGLFIDRFVEYLNVHRGIVTISRGAFTLLQASELRHLVDVTIPVGGEHEGNDECTALKGLIQSADLSQASIEACQKAINLLQWVFDSSRPPQTESGTGDTGTRQAGIMFAWPATVSTEFVELLLQRRPEALVVLAHYAVLLHWMRELWVIRDGGIFLIQSIIKYLGSYWEPWLKLPISVISSG